MAEHNHQNENHREAAYEKIGELVSIFQRGKRWYANFQRDGEQVRQSLKTTSKKQARQKAIALEAQLIEGRYERPVKAPSIESVFHDYVENLKAEGRAKKTLSAVELVQRRVLELGRQRRVPSVDGVDLEFIDAYRNMRTAGEKKPADKTMTTEVVIIRQMVNFALSRNKLQRDPLNGLKIRKAKPRPQPCWTTAEVDRLLAAASGPHRPSLVLLAATGMRVGELRWLTWDDVDLNLGVIKIRPKDDWKPKSGDQRAIPISAEARAQLSELPQRHRWVVTAAPSRRYPQGNHQISERRLLRYLKRVLKRVGLKGHLHTFRHSFISDALVRGTPEAIVRQWVGHVDHEILKHYTHIHDAASQAAMQRLDETRKKPLQ
ncbi:MAG TPA: site-specific integrase [Pirellulales bacterium]|jgi:site-specific recombinase XerD|nr:site-specific integrase [Pirellulales bacterium]